VTALFAILLVMGADIDAKDNEVALITTHCLISFQNSSHGPGLAARPIRV
jgi:hypothetical protein